ncbi:MAG: MOSC domain-containing protein [Pseudomonadota bacterium]
MLTLAELQARYAAPGRIEGIWLRPARGEAMVAVEAVDVTEAGLTGDRARKGKRAVTLIQAEHLAVIAALAGLEAIDPAVLRRNIVVSGLNLAGFRGKRLRLGAVTLELTVPCHPCSKMETVLGHGGYTAMRGHGGMCATVVTPGWIEVGSGVMPLDAATA